MSFKQQVLVLKGVHEKAGCGTKSLTGIARIELDGEVAQLFLSLINLPAFSSGQYFLTIIDCENRHFSFCLGARPTSFNKVFPAKPNLTSGVAVGLYFVKDNIPLTLAFARTEEFNISLEQFKKIIAEKQLEQIKLEKALEEKTMKNEQITKIKNTCEVKPQNNNLADSVINVYDDEAVATENYFNFDKKCNAKRNFGQNVRIENELPYSTSTKTEKEKRQNVDRFENEANCNERKELFGTTSHYSTVKQELTLLFEKYPTEPNLQALFFDSRWAKIHYSKEKYYVVGVIKENGAEKYVCYGVPATYSPNPPEQLKGYCSFVPASIFNMTGAGYWMLFQDAFSGKCIVHK